MKRPPAIFLAGLFSILFIIGSVFMAFQAGMLASATTTVQVNGDINVPEMKDKPAGQDNTIPEVVFVTRTQIITQDPIVQTVYITVTEENHQREAELLQQLNEAYRLLRERDAAYQAKLKAAYNLAQASAAKVPANSSSTNQAVMDRAGLGNTSGNQTTGQQTGSGQTGSGQTNFGHTGGTQTTSTQTGATSSTLQLVSAQPVSSTHEGDLSEQNWTINGSTTSTVSSLQNVHDVFTRYTNTQQTASGQFVNLDYQNFGFPLNRTADPIDTVTVSSTSPISLSTRITSIGVPAVVSSPTPATTVAPDTSTPVDSGSSKKGTSVQHKTNTRTGADNSQKVNGTMQNNTPASVSNQQVTSSNQNNTSDRKDNDSTQNQQSSRQNKDHQQQDKDKQQEHRHNQPQHK